ncbi:MAG: glycosyltransferase family 2 protein [Candidatus Delongbacteria bacterium]|nr:glycosyltransferase family 2 protein [Candidatus Delongbacteria bacterium]
MDHLKISVIVPVYNGEETLEKCLNAISKIQYSKDLYEVILVNDGSTDNTEKIAEKFEFLKIVDFKVNKGRLIARKTGAEKASFNELLFVDSRIEIYEDILLKRNEIGYSPLIAGDLGVEKYSSIFDTLFYLIRKKIYSPYFPQVNYKDELWITSDNFFNAPKGTGCFFIDKNLFLDNLPEDLSKDSNDDTKIMKNIVNDNVKILRHTGIRLKYHQRKDNNIYSWIHHRGKIWADHYLTFVNIYSILYCLVSITFLVLLFNCIGSFLFLFVLLLFLLGVYLAENVKDFFIVIRSLPVLAVLFYFGTIKKLSKNLIKKLT